LEDDDGGNDVDWRTTTASIGGRRRGHSGSIDGDVMQGQEGPVAGGGAQMREAASMTDAEVGTRRARLGARCVNAVDGRGAAAT
jgi:hypothetical protein